MHDHTPGATCGHVWGSLDHPTLRKRRAAALCTAPSAGPHINFVKGLHGAMRQAVQGSHQHKGLYMACILESDLFLATCVWLLSREGFSKGSSASFNPPSQGPCKVCMFESDLSLLCADGVYQGKASARALSHCSVTFLKGSARFVCLNLIYSLLCACGFYQGKASARVFFMFISPHFISKLQAILGSSPAAIGRTSDQRHRIVPLLLQALISEELRPSHPQN